MIIRRGTEQGGWFAIPRALCQDTELSLEARGVMAYLLSKPDDWTAQLSDLEREGRIGREKRWRIVDELERAGYLERRKVCGRQGRLVWEIVVHDTPLAPDARTNESAQPKLRNASKSQKSPGTGLPSTVEPSTAEPSAGEPSTAHPSTYMKQNEHKRERQKRERKEREGRAPAGGQRQPDELAELFFEFYLEHGKAHGAPIPYRSKSGDFVQLDDLRKLAGDWLTADRFRVALANYFASEITEHTLADICQRFRIFFKHPLNQYKQPLVRTNGGNDGNSITTGNRRADSRQGGSGSASDHALRAADHARRPAGIGSRPGKP